MPKNGLINDIIRMNFSTLPLAPAILQSLRAIASARAFCQKETVSRALTEVFFQHAHMRKKGFVGETFGACGAVPDTGHTFDANAFCFGWIFSGNTLHRAKLCAESTASAKLRIGLRFCFEKVCRTSVLLKRGVVGARRRVPGGDDIRKIFLTEDRGDSLCKGL